MIGLYPLTGQTTFLILAPWFANMTIDLGNGKELKITTIGGDRNSAPYVQSLKVNSKPWDKAWLTWDDVFANGGTLEYVLGAEAVEWNTGKLPPSPASWT
jgi:putative alpha-1,2-mannosidase